MVKCDLCSSERQEAEMTTIIPSKYLGQDYPNKCCMCPVCFGNFIRKTKAILDEKEQQKKII